MKKILVAILAVAMLLSICLVPAMATDAEDFDPAAKTPIVGVLVNGANWYAADLTPYLGQDNVWVEVPLDVTKLNSGIENYFSLRTNVNSVGNMTDTSVDLLATAQENASGSFVCSQPWCGDGFAMYTDRRINIQIQIDKGNGWETLSGDAEYKKDFTTVLGQFQSGDWFNAARNIVLPEFSGAVKARALVNLHVGKDITAMETFPGIDGSYAMNQMGWYFYNSPTLNVRFNGTWYGVDLQSYVEQAKQADSPLTTWVYCPIPLSAVNNNNWNYINLSSNVANGGNGSIDKVNVTMLFSDWGDGQSFGSADQYCNGGWGGYGTTVNAQLELYDGRQWVRAHDVESVYNTNGGAPVLGYFTGNSTWYNYARNIYAGGLDMTKYTGARIAVNVAIGGDVAANPALITGDIVHILNPIEETPQYTVTVTAGEGGTVSGAPTDKVFQGDKVTLTATPNTDYTFLGWYDGETLVSNSNPYEHTVTADIALTAKFLYVDPTVYYNITATAGEGGTVTGAPTDKVQEGTAINLTAVPNEGYRFIGWFDGETKVSEETAYSFSATADVVLTAKFEAIPTYTVTATATQGGTVSGAPEGAVLEGASVTLTAAANEGFKFVGWYEGETLVSADAAYTFIATKSIALEGRFVDASHKTSPDTPGAATSTADSDQAAVKVRINGFWFGTYLNDYKGDNDVWVPVYIDISKLNANAENYFNVSSNVINHGNFTDSSVDLYATFADEGHQSFLTNHQWCDSGWALYNDRNINIKLQVFDGTQWITLVPGETPCYDEHTVLGMFADDGNWYNAARNMTIGDLSGYQHARVLVHMNVGSKLEVGSDYAEESFATFLDNPAPGTGDSTPLTLLAVLMVAAAAGFVLTVANKKRA